MAGCVNYFSPHVTLCSPRASPSLSFSGDSVHSLFRRSPSIISPRFQVVVAAEKAEPPPPLKIMISGAPASGKGTQCELITQKYGLVHISAGDLLRAEIASGSENGRLAKEHMEKGQLVPNEIVVMMVKDRLSQTDAEQNGWLLDGYPRSSSQATALQGFGFHPDLFIVLEVPEDILVERVVGRRLDPVTGKIYHLKYSPPETEEIAARLKAFITMATPISGGSEQEAVTVIEVGYVHDSDFKKSNLSAKNLELRLQTMASCGLWTPPSFSPRRRLSNFSSTRRPPFSVIRFDKERVSRRVFCSYSQENNNKDRPQSSGIQVYGEIERLLTETVKQSQSSSAGSADWSEVEGAWVLRPRNSNPKMVAHFIGGIFVGAAPQLTYRLFLERLAEKDVLVIATPYASGFDHFAIADEVQFKFDRCCRSLHESVQDLPSFGIGHSLGSLIHLLIGSRYAVQRNGNVFMAFNNKEASLAIPLFSPVLVPMAQSLGPLLSQVATSPTVRLGAEMTRKQLETLSPPIMKQILPLVEQLPPLYMDLVKGREDFIPKPEETRRLIRSYYGISRNLLIKFEDDSIDETPILAQVLGVESSISSKLDMSIRTLPGDHGLPLQQSLPDVPPAMADAVNRGSEFLANMAVGTPWESVAKEVGGTLGMDSKILRAYTSKDLAQLVDATTSWMASNMGPKLLRS